MTKLTRTAGSGALLGITMAVANALSYVFVLIISRAFGPADFGAYSALSAFGIVLSVPAGALQVIVARHIAKEDSTSTGIRLAIWLGTLLAGFTIIASMALETAFRLDSPWPAIWAGLTLIPMTMTGTFQGILLGQDRLPALSSIYVSTAVGRLAAGGIGAAFGLNVTQMFALLFIAATLVAVQGLWLCRERLAEDSTTWALFPELMRATISLGAFIALTNVDTTLARVFLSEEESGGYALAATFGRAVGWGTQFMALLMIPRMQTAGRTRALMWANMIIILLGLSCVTVIAIAPGWWMSLVGGPAYSSYGTLAIACVSLGTLWALVQLWLFVEMSVNHTFLGNLTWIIIGIQTLVISLWFHDHAIQLVAVNAIGTSTIVAVALLRIRRLDSVTS